MGGHHAEEPVASLAAQAPTEAAIRADEREKCAKCAKLREALTVALEWIDAVPQDTPLPSMPGFDRDWVDSLIRSRGGE